jgi:uncharacterized membrane protein
MMMMVGATRKYGKTPLPKSIRSRKPCLFTGTVAVVGVVIAMMLFPLLFFYSKNDRVAARSRQKL